MFHKKNNFAEVFKNLCTDPKIILDYQNNYVFKLIKVSTLFAVLLIMLEFPTYIIILMVQQNYFQVCIYLNFQQNRSIRDIRIHDQCNGCSIKHRRSLTFLRTTWDRERKSRTFPRLSSEVPMESADPKTKR